MDTYYSLWWIIVFCLLKKRFFFNYFNYHITPIENHTVTIIKYCCRKADPFQGPKRGSCLTLGNKLPKETHVLTKQEILLGKGTQVESSRVREPRRTALLRDSQCRVLWWWGLGGLWPIILIQSLSWWCTHCSAKMDACEKDCRRWSDTWCLLLTFPEFFRLVVAC